MRSCRAVSGLNGLKSNLQVHTSHQRLHCWPARKGKNQKVIVSSGATYLSPVAVSTVIERTAGEEAPTPAGKLLDQRILYGPQFSQVNQNSERSNIEVWNSCWLDQVQGYL